VLCLEKLFIFVLTLKNFMFIRFFLVLLLLPLLSVGQRNIPAQYMHVDRQVRGTLSLPAGTGPFPVVVMVPGSGPNDRDGTALIAGGYAPCLYPNLVGQTLRPYRDLSDALVAQGYAVMRYDKLEFTHAANLGSLAFMKLWMPVLSGIDWLKTRAEIDTNQIVLLGHSEGSSLIPYAAQLRPGLAGLISLAGARTPFDTVLANQLIGFAQLCNGNLPQAQNEANQVLTYFNSMRQGPVQPTHPPLFGVPGPSWRDYVLVTDSVADRYNAVALPTLFVGLGLDVNVPPSELQRFQNEISIPAQFSLIDSVNHFLSRNTVAGFEQAVADTIIQWLQQQGIALSVARAGAVQLKAYPNPSSDKVRIELPQVGVALATWALFDGMGRVVLGGQWQAGEELELDLSALPAGWYHWQMPTLRTMFATRLVKR
jgi:dienelactone hydrolase